MKFFLNYVKAAAMLAMLLARATQAQTITGRSFYQPRTINQQPELLFGTSDFSSRLPYGKRGFAFSSTAFYQASTGGNTFARYFLPNGKNNLVVKGANAVGPCDISATWLQVVGQNSLNSLGFGADDEQLIKNQYTSTISIKPSFEMAGATLLAAYQSNLGSLGWRLAVGLPVGEARSNMHLREFNISHAVANRAAVNILNLGGVWIQHVSPQYSLSVVEALNNPNRLYGKIKEGSLRASGVGDCFVDASVMLNQSSAFGVRLQIPTAEKSSPEYLFAPALGSNGHTALDAYLSLQWPMLAWKDFTCSFKSHASYGIQFSGSQLRTFDLREAGPWSRYLLVVDIARNPHNVVPAANFLTQRAYINQLQSGQLGLGAEASYKNAASIGLNWKVFGREAEKVKIRGGLLPEQLFVAKEIFVAGTNDVYVGSKNGDISQAIGINNGAGLDPATHEALALSMQDLDLDSVATPAYLTNQLSAAVSIKGSSQGHQWHATVGSSYEWMQYRNIYNMYSLFGQLSIRF
ncbi:hypothetical protein EBZ39_12100 [bacterium]|nr:hypothetical protein [bacterium]